MISIQNLLINNIIVDYCYSGGGEPTLCLMDAMTVLSEDKTSFLFNLITFTYLQLLENPVY